MTGHKSLRKGKKSWMMVVGDGGSHRLLLFLAGVRLSVRVPKIYLHSWPYWNDVIHFESNSIFDSIRRIQVGRWLSHPEHKEANRQDGEKKQQIESFIKRGFGYIKMMLRLWISKYIKDQSMQVKIVWWPWSAISKKNNERERKNQPTMIRP